MALNIMRCEHSIKYLDIITTKSVTYLQHAVSFFLKFGFKHFLITFYDSIQRQTHACNQFFCLTSPLSRVTKH